MKSLLYCCLLSLAAQLTAAENGILTPNASLKKLADGFGFTEGPACDREGNVFFTDQPNDRILKWSVAGKLTTYLQPCGRANGLSFDRAGNLWACADAKNELWRIAPDGKQTVVLSRYQGKLLNGPNDVWIRPAPAVDRSILELRASDRANLRSPARMAQHRLELPGGLYFTDPYYERPWWQRGPKEMGEHVYYLAPDERTLTRVIDDLKQPNGIIGTPDGRTLYVTDIGANKTYRYRVLPDGKLTEKTLFCELGSDGMTIDSKGNVYLTGKGVIVFDPHGRKIAQIEVPENWTANVCFGGRTRRTLFITASKGFYSIELAAQGVDSQ